MKIENDLVVCKKIEDAFIRKESENNFLIIPEGRSISDAIVINAIGYEIIGLIDGEKTVREIANNLYEKYTTISYLRINQDVETFLIEMFSNDIINFMPNKINEKNIIYEDQDYIIIRSTEINYNDIINMMMNTNFDIDYLNNEIDGGIYNSVDIRRRLFDFTEDFYFLKEKNNMNVGIMSILNEYSKNIIKSNIGIIKFLKCVNECTINKFLKRSISNYFSDIYPECMRVRTAELQSDADEIKSCQNILLNAGFKQIHTYYNEFGLGIHKILYEYPNDKWKESVV